MTDLDRDAILARRRLFISAALAGLACTTHESPEQPAQPDQHAVVPQKVEVEGEPLQPSKPSAGVRPSWSEVMAGAPPLEVPQGLSKNETEMLTGLESSMRGRYAELEKIWTTLPECPPSLAECEEWAAMVQVITNTGVDWGALCGYVPETTNTYVERERVHEAYLREVADLLLADLDAAAKAHTAAADLAAWEQLRMDSQSAPHPCLSCMAPTATPVIESVSFEDGQAVSANLPTSDVLARVVEIHKRNRKTKLIVRGHADPNEPDPDGLAKSRAKTVAAELIQLGVNKNDLDVRGYGSSLPLTLDAAKAERNRRVDFEVMQR